MGLDYYKEEYGISFKTSYPYSNYVLEKNRKILHKGSVINLDKDIKKVEECALEFIKGYISR